MTMRWIAQASARGGEQSIISLVTSTWSCPAILFRAAFYFSKRGTFFQDYFLFFWKVSTREPPLPFLRDPLVSKRPHSSPDRSIKEPEPLNSRQKRCHSPSHTAQSKLLYMPHLALGWVAFPEATHGRRRCGIPAAPDISPNFPAAHGHLGSALAFGQSDRGCYRRVPPHGKFASIGIWLRANAN